MKFLCAVLLVHFLSSEVTCHYRPEVYKLEQLQVLFRHGDRVPDKQEVYKTDPYDSIFQQLGYGELTRTGMQRGYEIGQNLRQRYGSFLGDYKSKDVYAYSSAMDRTKMSLQLVLAGLYPPTPKDPWNNFVRPIPTHYDSLDTSFLTPFLCPIYLKMFQEACKSQEILSIVGYQKYGEFYEFLKNKTGITQENVFTAFSIYNNLRASLSMGLPLPMWCSQENYETLQYISTVFYDALISTEAMTRTVAGPMFEQFLDNMEESRKIFLYGAHDVNLAVFTRSLNITGIPSIPDFGSTLIMEKLRGPDNQIYMRFFLWTGVSRYWIPLNINNCGDICPLSVYKKMVESMLPDDLAKKCTSMNNLCKREKTKSSEMLPAETRMAHLYAGEDLISFKYMQNFSSSNISFN